MNASFTTDFKSFNYGIMKLIAKAERVLPEGLHKAVEQLKHDALNEVPMCPKGTGHLASEHHVLPVEIEGSRYTGTLAVTTPYAAALHEGYRKGKYGGIVPFSYQAGQGPKWIETKLINHMMQYIGMATNELYR
jgi:hypothetical protein